MTTTSEILKRLHAAGSAANVAGMARYGIRPAKAYGVATPVIRSIARELGRNTKLASALWSTNVLEARMLATMIADPAQIPEEEVERWVREFDCWSVCDSACIGLLWKTPFAWRKVREWSRREPEYERRAAFALLAGLAVHDKKAAGKQFRAALRLISKAAIDERNFVKKAVNWALRQIGKRNAELREAAIEIAESLIATESRSARWIGRDAVRELRRQAVR
jgi:3-methyladenine DNA glycosylase AlkD